ncbi:VanZ family protein [Rhodohalobacter sp. 614A]|uniref:VanZ family protein n=1 Tax=Rhodohalobacter sp. 614A TaxID=2908649 RepID=UPI001F213ACD|nr:VanZ family protein [Rhodohalobacter sp. 614A]
MIDRVILFCLRNRQLLKILLVLTTFIILFLTMLPPDKLGESSVYEYDKLGHFLIFFGWTLLYGLFMFEKKRTETKFILIFIIGCIFGIVIEILQGVLPIGRTMDIMDALTDIIASFIAMILLFLIKRRYLSREMEEHLKKI